jgi:hypothetical protein
MGNCIRRRSMNSKVNSCLQRNAVELYTGNCFWQGPIFCPTRKSKWLYALSGKASGGVPVRDQFAPEGSLRAGEVRLQVLKRVPVAPMRNKRWHFHYLGSVAHSFTEGISSPMVAAQEYAQELARQIWRKPRRGYATRACAIVSAT